MGEVKRKENDEVAEVDEFRAGLNDDCRFNVRSFISNMHLINGSRIAHAYLFQFGSFGDFQIETNYTLLFITIFI